jgi:ribosomal protein L21E
MPTWKEGDRVRIVGRPTTEDDRKKGRYFPHMAGLTGSVTNIYDDGQIAVRVEIDSLTPTSREVHATATVKMREKFVSGTSEEQRKQLTSEELNFPANFVALVEAGDLEKA